VLLAREARSQGLQVVLTHGSGVPIPQQQEAAKMGAFIELTVNGLVRSGSNAAKEAAERIRQVGAESYIIASDCGQMANPLPADCLALAARMLRAQGITERQLNLMLKENPAKLLGLPPAAPPSSN
jgi:predicted metal-dependent TIM-barrel fold hydrolase